MSALADRVDRSLTIEIPRCVLARGPYGKSMMQAAQWQGEEHGQAFGLPI
jgi:hypothetical protein